MKHLSSQTILRLAWRCARGTRVRLVLFLAALLVACAPAFRSTTGRPPTAEELSRLWVEPDGERETFYGAGGAEHAPKPDVVYRLVERKTRGFSPKAEVRAPDGTKWSVKWGDEAQSEVTSSRIVWALGYHQPPDYYLPGWRIEDEAGVHRVGPARFRPHLKDFESRGTWSWHVNPFVGSTAFKGLIVLMMVLNSTDLKDDNNEIYSSRERGGSRELYTVKDLGASLGETGRTMQHRNNIDYFEKQAFITGVEQGLVRFEFHGRFKDLIRQVTPGEVKWLCARLRRLSERQWRDAFRAGGYDEPTTERYLRKIRQKIEQGLSLPGSAGQ